MTSNHLFCVIPVARLLNPTHVQSSVYSTETAHPSHIISIVGKFVSCETILARFRRDSIANRKSVEIFAFMTIWAASTSEEEANVCHASLVGTSKTSIALDVTPRLRLFLTKE